MAKLPLEGVRVVSFSTAFAGPTLSRYLADYGAEVIKVESKRRPDNTRGYGGAFVEPETGANTSPGFGHFNRNKRDIMVDMSKEEGRRLIMELIGISDVVTENFSLRVVQNWGLDYENLKKIKPDIILLDMQGLGQAGPYKDFITYGPTLHSYVGLTSLWGFSHASFVDYIAAEHGVVAILAALLYRQETGKGVHIDLGQAEAGAAMLGVSYLHYLVNGQILSRLGNQDVVSAPSGCFRCLGEDAWCVISITSDQEWEQLVRVMGCPEWTNEEKFRSASGRRERAAELHGRLESWTVVKTPEEVETLLQAHGIPAAAVRAPESISSDLHLQARQFFGTIHHPIVGPVEYPGLTIRLSKSPGKIRRHAPLLGQDNVYVFHELLGLPLDEVVRLTQEGVLA